MKLLMKLLMKLHNFGVKMKCSCSVCREIRLREKIWRIKRVIISILEKLKLK